MSRSSIGLSLAGDGRVLSLTPKTIRSAFHALLQATPRSSGDMIAQLRRKWLTDRDQQTSALDRLLSRSRGRLTLREVQRVERNMNSLIVQRHWQVTQPEWPDGTCDIAINGHTRNRRSGHAVLYNGGCFEVRMLSKSALLDSEVCDVFIENGDRTLRFCRFHGVVFDKRLGGLCLELSDRYHFSIKRRELISSFSARRVGRVIRVQCMPGFHLDRVAAFQGC